MSHGTPDWGLVGPKATTFGLDDLGEHAVRMGSPHLFDRRGDVLLATDFREGLGSWIPYLSGLNAALELWTGHSRSGPYSLRCVTGSTANWWGGILNRFAYPALSRWGLEFTFSLDVMSHFWYGRIRWDTRTDSYDARIQLDRNAAVLQYWNGVWVPFATILAPTTETQPNHTLKFVVDTAVTPPVYVRVIFNDVTYSLANIPVQRIGAAARPLLWITVLHLENMAANRAAFLDNVIVTQNEP